jgi:hypothetical protein
MQFRRLARLLLFFLAAISIGPLPSAQELSPLPQIEDLYKTDVALEQVTLPDERTTFYIRQRADPQSRTIKQSEMDGT